MTGNTATTNISIEALWEGYLQVLKKFRAPGKSLPW